MFAYGELYNFLYYTGHRMLRGLQTKLKLLSMGRLQGEKACIKGSDNILFEILHVWSMIIGHRIHQLGSLAKSAWIGPNRLSYPVGEFYDHTSRITNEI